MEEVFFICLCICLGLGSGFVGGLLGIGGGVIIVPALALSYELSGRFEINEQLVIAVATSLFCIIFTSASAGYAQFKAGKVRWDLFKKLVLFLLLGSFAAGFVAPWLPTNVFQGFIAVFLGCVAIIMLSSWQPNPSRVFPGKPGAALIGSAGGLTAGLAGIAGGNVIVPTLVYFNTPIHNATATSSTLGVPIALIGSVGYLAGSPTGFFGGLNDGLLGYVDLNAAVPVIVGALIAAPLGVRFAHRVPASHLKKAFGALLVLVSLRMFYGII